MTPYHTTSVFDAETLPEALRREHRTKSGVWGIIRVLEGRMLLHFRDRATQELNAEVPGLVAPQEVHWVGPVGPIQMVVEFYHEKPSLAGG